MSFLARTKDDPGYPGRATDQQQAIDNEAFLFAGLVGPAFVSEGPGIVRQFVKKTGIVDNTATEVFTISTTDETGSNDGGVYACWFHGIAQHAGGKAGDNAAVAFDARFTRAMKSAAVGQNTAVVEITAEGAAAESEGGTTKGIATVTMTVVETSEFVQ